MPDDSEPLPPAEKLEELARADMDHVANLIMDLAAGPTEPAAPQLIDAIRSTLTRVGVTIEMLPSGEHRTSLADRMTALHARLKALQPRRT